MTLPNNSSLPSLKELLSEKTMFIMGAGSTHDYGFPLWADLKKTFLKYLTANNFPKFSQHAGADYWRDCLQKDTALTVDRLAYDADDDAIDLFMYMIYFNLSELEENDRATNKIGWIETFASKYLELLRNTQERRDTAQAFLSNLYFCSLNYERCFAFRFARSFFPEFKKIVPNRYRLEKLVGKTSLSFNRVYQPHGAIGQFDTSEIGEPFSVEDRHHFIGRVTTKLPYGSAENTLQEPNQNRIRTILPTSFIEFGKNETYQRVNQVLHAVRNIIFIGLSNEGISQSALSLPLNARMYCTGSEQIVDGCKPLGVFTEEFANNLMIE